MYFFVARIIKFNMLLPFVFSVSPNKMFKLVRLKLVT